MAFTLKETGGKPLGGPPRTTHHVEWSGGVSGDNGAAAEIPQFGDKSVQVSGTFGDGTLTIQGTNEVDINGLPTNWQTLSDPQGNALTFTSGRIEQILETTRFIRPSMSGATGTGMKVSLMARRDRGAKS